MALFPTEDHWKKYRWIKRVLKEENDCSVVAMAQLTGAVYQDCHAACKKRGREDRKGFELHPYMKAFNDMGFCLEYTKVKSARIKYAIKELPRRGRFLIDLSAHFTAYIDGVWMDHTPPNDRRIYGAYKLLKAQQGVAATPILNKTLTNL